MIRFLCKRALKSGEYEMTSTDGTVTVNLFEGGLYHALPDDLFALDDQAEEVLQAARAMALLHQTGS